MVIMAENVFRPPEGGVYGFHGSVLEFQGQLLHVLLVAGKEHVEISNV